MSNRYVQIFWDKIDEIMYNENYTHAKQVAANKPKKNFSPSELALFCQTGVKL